MDWTVRLSILAVLLISRSRSSEGCKLDQCSRVYSMAMDEEGLSEPEASPAAFCHVLHAYGQCVRGNARTCRGNLKYHTTSSLLSTLTARYNCSEHARTKPSRPPTPATPPPTVTTQPAASCSFHGRHKFRHCGLFGDPHLKTFDNQYQTCRVRGAWPLIDNPYLAVQVTNDPVLDASPATATTKVTIIIKGRSTPCTMEKTYEATADAPLPAAFIDGTYRSGVDGSVEIAVGAEEPYQRVEIYIRYIETTLVIRRVGKYLAFSAKLPEELVESSLAEDNNVQLCARGCPPLERLDLWSARGHAVSWGAALERCRSSQELTNEIDNTLTDHYLDWCVFDAMTAGVVYDFTAAAHSAQADVLRLDPASLHNRTEPLQFDPAAAKAVTLQRISMVLLLALLAMVNAVAQ